MLTTREALEAALVRTPDDVALHMAYADCLIEEGDPRGEWIRLALLVEDETISESERDCRRRAEYDYGERHELDLLGPLAIYHRDFKHPGRKNRNRAGIHCFWKRGWVTGIGLFGIRKHLLRAARRHPLLRFLDTLTIETGGRTGGTQTTPDGHILHWTGFAAHPRVDYDFLRRWPHQPISRLDIRDSHFGDAGVAALVGAPCFVHLCMLELNGCGITDAGAALLAAHPCSPTIRMELRWNRISPAGFVALTAAGIAATS